jgi:hypothetical protein
MMPRLLPEDGRSKFLRNADGVVSYSNRKAFYGTRFMFQFPATFFMYIGLGFSTA